jgi:hypothetical protein
MQGGKNMYDIPEIDRNTGILNGIIDIHCHAAPCLYEKDYDEIETAAMMKRAGYAAVLFKQHVLGANRIEFVRKAVPGIKIFGGIALNQYVGGLNPLAVASCIMFGGKEVKFPNIHARHHLDVFKGGSYKGIGIEHHYPVLEDKIEKMLRGIYILDDTGQLLPEVYDILEMVASADIGLETGHISPKETIALIKAAKAMGVKKIWVTHVNWHRLFGYTLDDISRLADEGVYIELSAAFSIPSYESPKQVEYTASIIKRVGAERCIMSTDLGTGGRYNPVEGMRIFIRSMLREGIAMNDISKMTRDNPATVLGL